MDGGYSPSVVLPIYKVDVYITYAVNTHTTSFYKDVATADCPRATKNRRSALWHFSIPLPTNLRRCVGLTTREFAAVWMDFSIIRDALWQMAGSENAFIQVQIDMGVEEVEAFDGGSNA